MLELEEEKTLARSWREHGDRRAADRLITSHLRLVIKIANRYRAYGLPLAELVSEGNVGLIRAARRFDPDAGCRFGTYATWWIKATIRDYIFRSWSLVRIANTDCKKNLFFNLRRVKARMSVLGNGDLDHHELHIIAHHFGVSPKEVVDMNRRLMGDSSLNDPISDNDDAREWQDCLADGRPNQETELVNSGDLENRRSALRAALNELTAREHRIFVARYLADDPMTLVALAQELRLSCEGVRKIEIRAYAKVQKAVRRCVRGEPRVHRASPPSGAVVARYKCRIAAETQGERHEL